MDRKPLIAFLILGLVATVAGAGLYAYFSDTENKQRKQFFSWNSGLKS